MSQNKLESFLKKPNVKDFVKDFLQKTGLVSLLSIGACATIIGAALITSKDDDFDKAYSSVVQQYADVNKDSKITAEEELAFYQKFKQDIMHTKNTGISREAYDYALPEQKAFGIKRESKFYLNSPPQFYNLDAEQTEVPLETLTDWVENYKPSE